MTTSAKSILAAMPKSVAGKVEHEATIPHRTTKRPRTASAGHFLHAVMAIIRRDSPAVTFLRRLKEQSK